MQQSSPSQGQLENEVVEMNTKQTATILLSAIAFVALLGCIEQPPVTPQCKGEGQAIPIIAEPPQCCPGLTLIPPREAGIIGISGYCTALCGNGSCDEIESSNNCPDDCPAGEQLVGPDYYGSEQEAFDALGEELEGMGELSAEDLEQLLGE